MVKSLQAFCTALGGEHTIAVKLKKSLNHSTDGGFILDDQNTVVGRLASWRLGLRHRPIVSKSWVETDLLSITVRRFRKVA